MKTKIAFIGGQPKGFKEAFSEKTHSGKILRGLVQELDINAVYFDLWKNAREEKRGRISESVTYALKELVDQGYKIVVLGRYPAEKLYSFFFHVKVDLDFWNFPHPSRRKKQLCEKLVQLIKLDQDEQLEKKAKRLAGLASTLQIIYGRKKE